MGSFFSAKTTNKGTQSGSSTPTFVDPRAQGLIDQLAQKPQGTDKSNYLQGLGTQSIIGSLGQGAQTVDATGAMDAIRASSAAQTPVDVANVRSSFYNRPTGRNDIAVADTVARNNANRDAALYNTQLGAQQFNANAVNQHNQQNAQLGQYLSEFIDPAQRQDQQYNQNALQLLSLLRGDKTTGTSVGSGTSTPSSASIVGNMLGSIGGGIARMCWVARAVYGDANPTWLVFRDWMLNDAPEWLFKLYLKHGESFAEKVSKDAALKRRVKKRMDSILLDRFKIIRN